jgi:hypothetical protein
MVHLYFAYAYFKTLRLYRAEREEQTLLKDYGQWSQPSDKGLLPRSHRFIADICKKYNNTINCFWKTGTSTEESIDMFVTADLIYVSGSSYSQTFSLFNAKNAIKIVAVTKELNPPKELSPQKTVDHVPFLSTHTTAYSSLKYYHVTLEGTLYNEQLAYLNMDQPQNKDETEIA